MRVICAGEMLVDIFVRPVQQIPFENDTQIVPDIRITSGGDANNNAINFAKLGHQVAYLGRLGCDEMGDYVASLAQAAGIDISHTVRSSTARQTKSVILVNPKGDRTFLQDPGTSAEFCITLGSACSALAIQAVGATAGMGSRATVNDFIHSHQPLDFRSDIS